MVTIDFIMGLVLGAFAGAVAIAVVTQYFRKKGGCHED